MRRRKERERKRRGRSEKRQKEDEKKKNQRMTVTYAEKAPRGSHLQVQGLPYRTEKVLWQVGHTKESRGSGLWKQPIIGWLTRP